MHDLYRPINLYKSINDSDLSARYTQSRDRDSIVGVSLVVGIRRL